MDQALSAEQRSAVSLALEGHSFLLTGAAGTGKSRALQAIINTIDDSLIICGATGLSSAVLAQGLHNKTVITLHSAFGLMDGRHSATELVRLYSGEDAYYVTRRKAIRKAHCLIIDEISMVSSHTLNCINRICQFCRSSDLTFGGMQRIFCGDFLQLPPIANDISDDPGQTAILSHSFSDYVPHNVELTKIQRTSDTRLITAIHEVSRGTVSDDTMKFLSNQKEPLNVAEGYKLVVYGQRINVICHNAECLARHSGQLFCYTAQDCGSQRQLSNMLAEKKLMLKVGVPVMLIQNLSEKLVNGLCGRVASLANDVVVVHFPSLTQAHSLKPTTFTRYDRHGRTLCKRVQIPLVLSFATTVHKSQGLSVDHIEVHAEDMYYPGLLPVAISRVRSTAGLRIVGFDRQGIIAPQQELLTRITEHGTATTVTGDKSCCLRVDTSVHETDLNVTFNDSSDDEEMVDESITDQDMPSVSTCDQPCTAQVNTPNVVSMLNKQVISQPFTELQKKMNADIKLLQSTYNLSAMYDYFERKLNTMYTNIIHGNIKPKNSNGVVFNDFRQQTFHFVNITVSEKLSDTGLDAKFHRYLRQLFLDMINSKMDEEAKKLGEKSIHNLYAVSGQQPTVAGRGVLRRIGGRTVYLMRKDTVRRLKASIADPTSNKYKFYQRTSQCLQVFLASLSAVKNGKYPESAKETERKCYRPGALTHISDDTFEFFIELEKVRESLQQISKGLLDGPDVLKNCYNALLSNTELQGRLYQILPSHLTEDRALFQHLWKLLLLKYLPVCNNGYRKTLLTSFDRTKDLAHRIKVAAAGETSAAKKAKFTSQDVDSQCQARQCKIRSSAVGGRVRWVECSMCQDWYHLACTTLNGSITDNELEDTTWHCMHCKNEPSSCSY